MEVFSRKVGFLNHDLKKHNGQKYTGMQVDRGYEWNYPDGKWQETKVAPDRWEFAFSSTKIRNKPAPVGSDCDLGTQYHRLVVANQCVRKIDTDSYKTFMQGMKFKIGYKKPNWRDYSATYPGQDRREEVTEQCLKFVLDKGL